MAWVILIAAGLLEAAWAIALKKSGGFTRLTPSLIFLVTMAASMVLLAMALRSLPVSVGYAVWTGIGAVTTAALGMWLLGEAATLGRILPITLITTGIIWLAVAGS